MASYNNETISENKSGKVIAVGARTSCSSRVNRNDLGYGAPTTYLDT